MEEEQREKTKKRNKVRRAKHLPWDEVSLPGAGTSPNEQQTIFEVINNNKQTAQSASESDALADVAGTSSTNNTTTKAPSSKVDWPDSAARASDDLVSNHSETANTDGSSTSNDSVTSQIPLTKSVPSVDIENEVATTNPTTEATKARISTPPAIDRQCSSSSGITDQGHVLDIESHLIETYDEYQTEDDSVGINELLPQQDELIVGSSKVETDANVHTVIEVEPIGSVSRKPIQIVLQAGQAQRIEADNEATAAKNELIINNEAAADEQSTKTETLTEAADKQNELSDAIKETAERLVNEIEREVLAALSKGELKAEDDAGNLQQGELDKKTEPTTRLLDDVSNSLTQKVDAQLSEVTSILKSSKPGYTLVSTVNGEALKVDVDSTQQNELKIVNVPSPKTPSDVEERKLFLESLPQIDSNAEAQKLADDCKREYYQSLKKYLIEGNADRPPLPLQTYRWEDLRRAKERGGYPWTHLYKRPLGPDEEPEVLLLLRKSQEIRFLSESPKSLKKVRIDEQVIVKQPERYIQELSEAEDDYPQSAPEDEESHSLRSESISCVSDSILATCKPRKPTRLEKIRGYLRRRKGGRSNEDAQSLPCASIASSRRHSEEHLEEQPQPQVTANGNHTEQKHCYPIMKKLKSMADRQKKRLNIRRIHLGKDEKIVLGDETKILKLKNSPKAERGEIPHFIEKQDSDDVLEIMELDESPSRKRRDDGKEEETDIAMADADKSLPETMGVVVPDEVIEIPQLAEENKENVEEAAATESIETPTTSIEPPTTPAPKKAPRLRREHVYEEIGPEAQTEQPTTTVDPSLLQLAAMQALKESLAKQDSSALKQIEESAKPPTLDRMGSSEEEQITATALSNSVKPSVNLLAPLSSIDSTSSDEDRNRTQLSPVTEESDAASAIEDNLRIISDQEPLDLKPAIKKEASPAPSDKKVTFSHVEDEAEPHREDIELPIEVQEAAQAEVANRKKWLLMSDHEYEPIAAPTNGQTATEPHAQPDLANLSRNIEKLHADIEEAQVFQNDIEERYFSSAATTPRTDSRTNYEIHTSQVDSSALEELPLQPENRKKGFMASAQDRTRKMQAGIRSQAGKIKTKLRTPAKKPASSSPKAKERKRFKAPEFSKMKMPEIKRPDMSKLADFKRPEFTKFNKPDMSKFKLPEKFSTIKLKRSKSFKENEVEGDEEMPETAAQTDATINATQPQKKMFDFKFDTFPRAFRKKKPPLESEPSLGTEVSTGTEGVSVIPSTETQPSLESSSSPQGDRGPGPVRSRWADKFSDVSYNDSEGSRYRRYGSEQESFERESSLERRMKDDLEETESEPQEMSIMGRVADTKQFAEFDEENRAIHEISKMRAGEFRRRPMVHQDSDLRSEDSKEVEGWTDKEIEKNKLLRKAELEAETSYLKYVADDIANQETQSAASSGKKVVMEEIDDDEFFLRKRGVSEDNIELRQYISNAIREGYDRPYNALEQVGKTYEPREYGDYDVPPPKPKRLHKNYRSQDASQELEFQRSEYGDDLSMSQNGSDFYAAPKRPLRKRGNRSKYSMDSQDFPVPENLSHEHYFDDDEDYLRPPRNNKYKDDVDAEMNDLDVAGKQVFPAEAEGVKDGAAAPPQQPQAPTRRRKRDTRESSMDKDSYMNGFGGRSVSNSRLQPTEDVIVYRTEHEYPIPLASAEKFTPTPESRTSRLTPRYDEDERNALADGSLELDFDSRGESQVDNASGDGKDKFVIDMLENDGYAVVRKEHLPKPTPPARRKKFSRSPGERFTTISAVRSMKDVTPPPPERPPPPRAYTPSTITMEEQAVVASRRKSATSLDMAPQILEDDYEEPGALQQERPESPRNLQSGDIVNRMKFRPLPAPPRPPREKRQRNESRSSANSAFAGFPERDMVDEKIATSSTADSYDPTDLEEEEMRLPEVEVSTQTDPLPDDFECEEFEITDDMRIIEPRINNLRKTLDELLKEEELRVKAEEESTQPLTEEEQLARGLQRFRDANQRSMSERSRASSQADRSKSQSRPPTPSAVVIERRVSTPIPSQQQQSENMLEASLIVRPIDDLDLEEEELRREGLLTDSSQQSKSDVEATSQDEEEAGSGRPAVSDYSRGPSSEELDAALEELRAQGGDSNYEEEKEESDLAEINEDEYYEKRADALLAKYSYLGEATSEKEEEPERKIVQEYQSETEEIATMSALSEDELQSVRVSRDEQVRDEDGKRVSVNLDEQAIEKDEQVREEGVQQLQDVMQASEKAEVDYHFSKDGYMVQERMEVVEETPVAQEPPLPPPRRKSTTTVDVPPTLSLAEQPTQEVTPVSTTLAAAETQPATLQLPTHLGELEVDRLRVHALQAGQVMVSQLHGAQISAEDLECKSGNLIVKNIALPEGFIEDIVERVRTTDRSQLLTVETQTSLQGSREALTAAESSPARELMPPPKPPRQRDLEAAAKRTTDADDEVALQQLRNYDEETQTEPMTYPAIPPPVFTTTEYLQSRPPPMELYNLGRGIELQYGANMEGNEAMHTRRLTHHHQHPHYHHHRRHRRCDSSCSECADSTDFAEREDREETRSRSHSRRSRSSTRPPTEPQSVGKAGQQFVSACSLSIAHMINRLTAAIRGAEADKNVDAQVRHIPTIVALFVLVSFTLIVYLLSGRNVHTHHWDFFNPPGNGPRPT